MNRILNKSNIISLIFSVLFAIGLYTLINDFNLLIEHIFSVHYSVFLIASLIYFISVILRYIRWKIIYIELLNNYKFNMLNETIIGYMANNILPFRIGELYRARRINISEKTNYVSILSTILTERITDVLALLIFILISFIFVDKKFLEVYQFNYISSFLYLFIFFFLFIISILFLRRFSIYKIMIENIFKFIKTLFSFFLVKRDSKLYLYIFILSISIWLIEAGVYFFVAYNLIDNINLFNLFFIILMVCAITNLSGIIPSLPGNIGNFEFFGTLTLVAFGINSVISGSIIIVVHLVLWIPITFLGIIIIILEKFYLSKKDL